jgi:hypothetical protein
MGVLWAAVALTIAQVVGDDILVTNPTRVKKAIDQKACNALLLKVNQIGTVRPTLAAYMLWVVRCAVPCWTWLGHAGPGCSSATSHCLWCCAAPCWALLVMLIRIARAQPGKPRVTPRCILACKLWLLRPAGC